MMTLAIFAFFAILLYGRNEAMEKCVIMTVFDVSEIIFQLVVGIVLFFARCFYFYSASMIR